MDNKKVKEALEEIKECEDFITKKKLISNLYLSNKSRIMKILDNKISRYPRFSKMEIFAIASEEFDKSVKDYTTKNNNFFTLFNSRMNDRLIEGTNQKIIKEIKECKDNEVKRELENEIVGLNQAIINYITSKYCGERQNLRDDIFAVASIGFLKALRAFNPDKNVKFSSFACVCMRNEIFMGLRSEKRQPIQVSIEQPIKASDLNGEEITYKDMIPSDLNVLENYITKEFRADIKKQLMEIINEECNEFEKEVIIKYYGLGDIIKTQREIAEETGSSWSLVAKKARLARNKIKNRILEIYDEDELMF